jgi:hypothetical protein
MKKKILNAMVIGLITLGAAQAEEAKTPVHKGEIAVEENKLESKMTTLVNEQTKKEIKEYHAKKKELWEKLSPEAKKLISAQKHRRYKNNKAGKSKESTPQ